MEFAKCIRETVRENSVPFFNDEWIDQRSNEMFVQQQDIGSEL